MVYNVSEYQHSLLVCFIHEIDTNLTFAIYPRDVTAISEWILFYCLIYSTIISLGAFDYILVPLNLTTVTDRQCTSVLIILDDRSEEEESFDVVLWRVDNNMISSYATVYISRNTYYSK